MIALTILLVAICISIFFNRVATKALVLTGLSRDVAEFQARSVITGTGFTTRESESIMKNPVRRTLVLYLMLIQNAGIITVISTFVLSFVNTGTAGIAIKRAIILIGGILLLIFLANNDWVGQLLEKLIDWLLEKYTDLHVIDYYTMLNLQEGYTVSRLTVEEDSWLSDKSLEDLRLQSEGVMVLCIESDDGSTTFAPTGKDVVSPGDELTVYGKEEGFKELKNRKNDLEGKEAHEKAKKKHEEERDVQ